MKKVMIYSNEHQSWWCRDYSGYTDDKNKAGIFDYDDAIKQYKNLDYDTSKDDYFVDVNITVENCCIEDIYLEYDDCHNSIELRTNLDCGGAKVSFLIPLWHLKDFIKDFYFCFDNFEDKVEAVKGKYLRAHFNDNEYLVAIQHITKKHTIELNKYRY